MGKRKTKQQTHTYTTDDETQDKLRQLTIIRSVGTDEIVGKSAVLRALIREAFAREKNDET